MKTVCKAENAKGKDDCTDGLQFDKFGFDHRIKYVVGWLVVTGGDSHYEDCEFESQYSILDGICFTLICCKIC